MNGDLPNISDISRSDATTTLANNDIIPSTTRSTSASTTRSTSASTTSNVQTLLAILKGNIGTGCLALPWAFSILGIPLGCFITCLMSLLVGFNAWTLVDLKRSVWGSQRGFTYSDVGEQAFGKSFRVVVDVSVILVQLSVCTVFFSNMGENLSSVFRQLFPSQDTRSHDSIFLLETMLCDRRCVMLILLPAILCLSSLPNLKSIAPSIALASFLMALTFVLIGIVICMNWSTGVTHWREDHASLADFVKEVDWEWVPLATCAIMYSLEGDQLILPIESAMTYPENFDAVLVVSMVFIAALFCVFSSVCVVAFGVINDGSITAYLLDHAVELEADQGVTNRDEVFGMGQILLVANVIVSLSLVFTYPLQLFPCIGLAGQIIVNQKDEKKIQGDEDGYSTYRGDIELEEECLKLMPMVGGSSYQATTSGTTMKHIRRNRMMTCNDETDKSADELEMEGDSLFLRFSMVIATFFVAIVIPHLKSLIALAGAITGAATSLIIPPLLGLKFVFIHWDGKKENRGLLCKRVCFYSILIIIGVLYGVLGTISSIKDIISQYQKNV